MKSTFSKIGLLVLAVVVITGVSRAGAAINMGSFYPSGAPATASNKIFAGSAATVNNGLPGGGTAVAKAGWVALGRASAPEGQAPAVPLDILGGFMSTGASVGGDTRISGKLRVAPIDTTTATTASTDIKKITDTTVVPLSVAVSVGGGHIVYDAKKPPTTRVVCTDNSGMLAPCNDPQNPETVTITGTGSGGYPNYPSAKNVSVAQSSIQGNTAALWGQIGTGGSISNTCNSGSWGTASPFNLSTSTVTCP